MAGAKPGVHVVQLKPIVVPKSFQDGAKFVKWDDDSTTGTPVTLRVDKKGFFLCWTDQNKETKTLEISSIRDTRTGKYARVPKDAKLRDTVNMGAPDTPLEDKTFTVVYSPAGITPDLVNVSFTNFCCNCREIAVEWTDEILKMAYNLLALNASSMKFLEKAYTKIILETDKEGKIPVKNILKIFAQNRDDKKRVEKALESAGYSVGKNVHINPDSFTFEKFLIFYKNLTNRQEVEKIFDDLFAKISQDMLLCPAPRASSKSPILIRTRCGGVKRKNNYLLAEQLMEFINQKQRDPRLNEILYPYTTISRAKELVLQYEPDKSLAEKGMLSFDGFLRYLMSDDNAIMAPEKFDLNADMDQSLSHYFINSSHNTYLTGHQLTGKSSVEMYRQCLLAGCRCVELDCWSGKTEEELLITHGYTVVTDIPFKEVIEAIAESAFKTSDYPVILSFENHCSAKLQAKMANYCIKIFGDMLLSEPLPTHPVTAGTLLPSPNQLLRKIIIKNKKKHYPKGGVIKKPSIVAVTESQSTPRSGEKLRSPHLQKTNSKESNGELAINGDELLTSAPNGDIKDSDSSSESEVEDDDASVTDDRRETTDKEQGTASQESEAGAELSALVNYVQPVPFHGFEHSEKKNRSYEISSFVETSAMTLLKERPVEFVKYNKRQLSRIYPKGTRVDSSNYMPQVYWNAGCQLVALNFQTLDLALQLNLGIFEYNGRSGYLLKPDFMRRTDRRFDPFAESTVDGIIAGSLDVQIISGQFLSDKRVGTYVEVETYGLPADTCRKKFKTKVVPANGINPVYEEEPFRLKKVVLPELTVMRIAAYEESGKFIGHRILPLVGLRPGYRQICLRTEMGQPLMLPSLFVHIKVTDYVPDDLSDLAEKLANPIKYYSELEKRTQQLSALTDDFDEDSSDETHRDSPSMKHNVAVTSKSLPSQNNSSDNIPRGDAIIPSSLGSSGKRPDSGGKTDSPKNSVSVPHQEPATDSVGTFSEAADIPLVADSFEKIKEESKPVQMILSKLEKDLQGLRKKHDKALSKEYELKQQREGKLTQSISDKKPFLKSHSKLLKKLSKTNVEAGTKFYNVSDTGESTAEKVGKLQDLQRTHSQAILSLHEEYYKAELELREKYHDSIYSTIEKAISTSQAAQMKELQARHESDKTDLLKRLDSIRIEETKKLKKDPRDKNELARILREVRGKHVKLAVDEISKLSEVYERKKKELEIQHEEVRKQHQEEKDKAFTKLHDDYEFQRKQLLEGGSALLTAEEWSMSKEVTSL